MNWRTTGILFLVVLLLGGYLYWQDQQAPTEESEATPTATAAPTPERVTLVTTITNDTLNRVVITRHEDEASATFEKREGLWWQTVPTTTQLISSTMAARTASLVNLTSNRTLASGANPPSAYGLDNPTYTIVLLGGAADGRSQQVTFQVGNKSPTDSRVYLQKTGDNRVHLVAQFTIDDITALLDAPPVLETLETP